MAQNEFTRNTAAPDGIHDNIEFNEYKDPAYWLKRRARRALIENLAPVGIVLLTLAAFVIMGYIELGGI